MEADSNTKLFEDLDRAIRSALRNTGYGQVNNDFVLDAADHDERLYAAKTIPPAGIRDLRESADEYFDAYAHGFRNARGMSWEQGRAELELRRRAVAEELGVAIDTDP